jgi:hypothetical protein
MAQTMHILLLLIGRHTLDITAVVALTRSM